MRWRPTTWLLLSVFFFVAACYFWNLGDKWAAEKAAHSASATNLPASKPGQADTAKAAVSAPKFRMLNQPAAAPSKPAALAQKSANRFKYRVTNTPETVGQLTHNDKAILLENALFDTSKPFNTQIPGQLHIEGDPGSYIVQAGGPIDAAFRARLKQAGASIIAYIPNNAYLVRASQDAAQQLAADADTTVLPYDAYYKLKSSLLAMTMQDKPLPANAALNILLFPDARDATVAAIQQLGGKILSEGPSPFGPVVTVMPPESEPAGSAPSGNSTPNLSEYAPALARLPGVEDVELVHRRKPANDLSRARIGVATDTQVQTNYLGLSGTNVFININDTGVDTNHPDLEGRITFDVPISGVDSNGHGTHVAGTIAGSGLKSTTVTNAEGSIMPGTNFQFRGMAPAAQLFSIGFPTDGDTSPQFLGYVSDSYVQQTAAQTNALRGNGWPLISNNSWTYGADNDYDLAAASYDAAVRDALPQVTGSQPILYVFAAGNTGYAIDEWDDGSGDDGFGGSAETIESPATAKNVITVGAIDQPRFITNEVAICNPLNVTNGDMSTNNPQNCTTNMEWYPTTDSSNEVPGFSAMGNVGVGTEGTYGRFKPDVVAPGTMVISTRSSEWDEAAYYNPTSYISQAFSDLTVDPTNMWNNFLFVPYNAVWVSIEAVGSSPLLIYVNQDDTAPVTNGFVRTNFVLMPPDGGSPLNPVGVNYNFAIADPTNGPVTFDLYTTIAVTNEYGDFLTVLSNMNNSIGPYYRYESGTSMAAAGVSGTLALMQQFFAQQLQRTNSAALMKALLINGSRTLDPPYDLGNTPTINYQGWGLINLPNSLGTLTNLQVSPKGPSSMFIFDQDPTNALATGQSHTRYISLSDPAASDEPLRVTLVWTDPPGNPAAGLKLVNNLLLVVTNRDTGDVFFGNDISTGTDFNSTWNTNTSPNLDVVNNVQNVYLLPPLGTNYSITVVGYRVNVNAVTEQTNDVVQDYALVISAGEGQVPDAFTLTDTPVTPLVTEPLVSDIVTNAFAGDANDVGGYLSNERTGASTPLWGTNFIPVDITIPVDDGGGVLANNLLKTNAAITLGMTNQWHFYAITNSGAQDFTNAVFATFIPVNLSVPREGVYQESNPANAVRFEPDIDLYVTTDPTITNLNPSAIASAYKSLTRSGEETVILSNAVSGTVYYAGVKSEDQQSAQYSFLADFSNVPFGSSGGSGNQVMRSIPETGWIPDASVNASGLLIYGSNQFLCVAFEPITVHRVIVTNNIGHQLMGDLIGTLTHEVSANNYFAVLNNHAPAIGVTNQFIYDDSGEKNILNGAGVVVSRHSDGPGSLTSFAGRSGSGQWLFSQFDTVPNNVGYNSNLTVFLEKQQDPKDGIYVTLQPGGCDTEYLTVPAGATNVLFAATNVSGSGPVTMTVCPYNGGGCESTTISGQGSGGTIDISQYSNPPLNPGTYSITFCNDGQSAVTVYFIAYVQFNLNPVAPTVFASTGPTALLDDAVTYADLDVPTNSTLVSVEVGVRINHPRVSDLALTLISPDGTRQLLMENRGALTTNGVGTDFSTTNSFAVSASGGYAPETNSFNTGTAKGVIQINYNMYQIPDDIFVYYGTNVSYASNQAPNLLWSSGFVSGTGVTNLSYPPPGYVGPPSTVITVVMNQYGFYPGGNTTKWDYSVTSAQSVYNYLTFTENTNLTTVPIKFAIPPFTNTVTATNLGPTVMSDSFEFGVPVTNLCSGGAFSGGWVLDSGCVGLLTNGYGPGLVCDSGNQCLLLSSVGGSVSTNLSLIPGDNYILTFAYAVDPNAASNGTPNATVQIVGTGASVTVPIGSAAPNTWANVNWQTATLPFTATSSNQNLTINGLGMLLDSFNVQLQLVQTGLYYLPEEPLTKIVGENVQGTWQLEIMDDRAGPAAGTNETPELLSWQLSFVLNTPEPVPIPLTQGTNSTNVVCNGQIQNFAVNVPIWATSVTNTLVSASEPVNVIFNSSSEAETNVPGDVTNLLDATAGSFTLTTNSTPYPLVPGSTYYVGVQSLSSNCASFVFQVSFPVTTLSNDVPVTSSMGSNGYQRYFVFNVATNATSVLFQLTNLNANAELVVSQVPFPDEENYEYGSFNPGTENQQIYIFTTSQPYPLAPGNWYLGVFNNSTTNVQYTIEAIESTNPVPNIITLKDGVPYTNSNSGASISDYYDFDVTNSAARAQFEIDNPTGEEVLVVRYGLPLPTLSSYELISDNPAPEGQLLVLYTNSGSILLTPGWWFLTAVNLSGGTNNYVIEATTWPSDGGPIVITDEVWSRTNVCLTWVSVPGFDYYIQGKVSLQGTNWFTASPTIKATSTNTTYCIPLPSEFEFFRVAEGVGSESVPLESVSFTSITRGTNGILLQWTAATNSQFLLQWSSSLSQPMTWNTFPGTITSSSTNFSYLDNGTQDGGLGGARYYRLVQVP